MSAFIVSPDHIDGLLTYGLSRQRYGPLRWFAPGMREEAVEGGGYEEGEPWGPRSIEIAETYRRELTEETASRVGAMLYAENRRSVNHRYAEDELDPCEAYIFRPYPGDRIDAVMCLKAVSCYEYQSCEHPGWETSEAFAFCRALEAHAIATLPGYSDAQGWELPPNPRRQRAA